MYLCDTVFKVVTSTKLTEDKNPLGDFTGWHSKIKLIKSRTNCAGSEAPLIYNQEYGYDRLLSTFNMVKDAGLVKGSGIGFYLEGLPSVKFSQKKFKEKLYESDAMKYCFKELVSHVGNTFLSGNTEKFKPLSEEEQKAQMDEFAIECMKESLGII